MRLGNNGEETGTLWVNGGVGYFIGEEDTVQYNEHIDLEWDDEDGESLLQLRQRGGHTDKR